MRQRRIGAYGGTFDPIHHGHVEIARAVAVKLDLDELLVVPAHTPPHKKQGVISEAYHRYAMSVLATLGEPRLLVSTVEIEAPERPYTFETLDRLQSVYGPAARLFFVLGSDSFNEIDTWREPAKVLARADLVVAARPGYPIDSSRVERGFGARVVDLRGSADAEPFDQDDEGRGIYLTDYVRRDISATRIRKMASEGQSIREYVPALVADYIGKYRLYRRDSNGSEN